MKFTKQGRVRGSFLAIGVTCLALWLGGCGGGEEDAQPTPSASTVAPASPSAPATTASPTPSDTPSPHVSTTPTPTSKPTVTGTLKESDFSGEPREYKGAKVPGETAEERAYNTWLAYELDHLEGNGNIFELLRKLSYDTGKSVCVERKSTTSAYEVVIQLSKKGVTLEHAEAVVQAALKAICPEYDTEFSTAFDEKVKKYVENVGNRVEFVPGASPPEYSYGWFMKHVCWELTPSNRPGNLQEQLTTGDLRKLDLAKIVDDDPETLKIFAKEAVDTYCPDRAETFASNW